jgi:purine-binding chemotaxis protein CheW
MRGRAVTSPTPMDPRATRLREAFDRGFALPPAAEAGETGDFLLLRAAGAAYALRVADMAGIAAGRTVVPVPGRRPELLGVAGIRGALVCVYSLSRLLGLPGPLGHPTTSEEAAWLALVFLADADPVALAFQELEGFVRVPRAQIHDQPVERADPRIRGVVQAGPAPRPVVDLATILEAIQKSAGSTGPTGSFP